MKRIDDMTDEDFLSEETLAHLERKFKIDRTVLEHRIGSVGSNLNLDRVNSISFLFSKRVAAQTQQNETQAG